MRHVHEGDKYRGGDMATVAQQPSTEPSDDDHERSEPLEPSGTRPVAWGLTGPDLLILGLVALLCIATLPPVLRPFWAPRAALLLIAVGPGLVLLTRRALVKDRLAICALALLAWASLSALISPSPLQAWIGELGTNTSVVFFAAVLACWALGNQLSAGGRQVFPTVLLAGLGISGLIGLLQVVGALGGVLAGRYDGRASGLTDNPVQFGPLMAAAAVLTLGLIPQMRRWWAAIPLLAYFAMCVNLSGTRIAIVALIVGTVMAGRHARGLIRLCSVAALLAGLVIGSLLPGSLSADSRLRDDVSTSAPVSGVRPRLEAWKAAGTATLERPLVGHGPGQFYFATTRHLSLDFAKAEGPDRVFVDAHNIVVEFATSTGLPSVFLLALLALELTRRARGPLALFGLTIAITWLVEPVSQNTAPLVLVALGAADRSGTPHFTPWARRTLPAAAASLGILAATALIVGDVLTYQASRSYSPARFAAADRWVPRSTHISDVRTTYYVELALATDDPALQRQAISSAERTVKLREARYIHWVRLGMVEGSFGSDETAVRYFREALERYPWSESAWRGLATASVRLKDQALLDEANEHLCLLGSQLCDQFRFDSS